MNLEEIVQLTWDGDISYEEATEEITEADVIEINRCLSENEELFADGVPFFENREWHDLHKRDIGAQKLQYIINIFEG